MPPTRNYTRPISKALGLAIRDARARRELSQEELGLRTGVHRTYISELERGLKSPTVQTVSRLSHALGLKPSALLALAEASIDKTRR